MTFGATDEILLRGVGAARDGAREDARFYLEWALRDDPTTEQFAEAWYWLSRIATDDAERRHCLGQVVGAVPLHPEARRDLAILNGRLRAEEIIDPDAPLSPFVPDARIAPGAAHISRCPRCGGALLYDPARGRPRCQFCGHEAATNAESGSSAPEEQDWEAAIYTRHGHRWLAPGERILSCAACGAAQTLPAGRVSTTCAFCGSPQVVEEAASDDLLAPDGLVPFSLDRVAARRHALAHLAGVDDGAASPTLLAVEPIYQPWWTFDIEGTIRWHGYVEERYGRVPRTGQEQVFHDDVLVAAGTARADGRAAGPSFDLTSAIPYDAALLAGWPAELYRLPPADASLRAREAVLHAERARIYRAASEELRDLTVTSVDLAVASYKLLLLPAWITTYRISTNQAELILQIPDPAVNGRQTHDAEDEDPLSRVLSWITGRTERADR